MERLIEVKQAFHSVFTSHDGKVVLDALRREFDKHSLHDANNPYMTYYNLGGRDVLMYIDEVIQDARQP